MNLIAPFLLIALVHVWVLCEVIFAPEGDQVPGVGFVAKEKCTRQQTRACA